MSILRNGFRAAVLAQLLFCFADAEAQDGLRLRVGMAGAGVNTWPAAESPDHAVDGVGQKYLNFGRENTGFLVSPISGSSIAESITFWTANDAEPRDPASFRLFGTNEEIDTAAPPGTEIPLTGFTEITSGNLTLPSSRNGGGQTALMPANSVTVDFANTNAYTSYLVVFPTVKTPASANSMQIAEVALAGAGMTPLFAPGDPILGGLLYEPGPAVGPQAAPTAGNWSVREWRPFMAVDGTAGADAVIADPQWQFDFFVSDGMAEYISFFDPQGGGGGHTIPHAPGTVLAKQPFFSNTPAADDDIVMRAVSKVIIPADGQYTFGIDGDDGTRLTLQGANFTKQGGGTGTATGQVIEFAANTGDAFTMGSTFLAAGEYDLELVWQERGGGAFVDVFSAPGVKTAIDEDFSPVGLKEEIRGPQGTLPTTVGQWTVRSVDMLSTNPLNNLADAQAAIDLDNGDPGVEFADNTMHDVINFRDPDAPTGQSGRFTAGAATFIGGIKPDNPDDPFPIEVPGLADDDFATQATVIVSIEEEGDYIFGFASDDGASLTLEGANFTILNPGAPRAVTNNGQTMEFNANTGNSDTFGTTHLAAGEYELTFLTWERGGGAFAEVYTGVGSDGLGMLTARLLGSPAEEFDILIPAGLQLGGEGGAGIDGDYNGNGTVEQADLDLVLLNWGTGGVPGGWVNDLPEGNIDQAELDGVLLNWGNSGALGSGAGVPEPSTMAILVLAAAGLLAMARPRRLSL
jgi:hypothetical protein